MTAHCSVASERACCRTAILVRPEVLPNGVTVLTTSCVDLYRYSALPDVVSYDGSDFGLTGWNSDRGLAYYKPDPVTAEVVR